jgi:hypothetical protein
LHENDVSLWLLKEVFFKYFFGEIEKLKSLSTSRLAVDNILYDSEKSVYEVKTVFSISKKRAENFSTSLNDLFSSPSFGCNKRGCKKKKLNKIHALFFLFKFLSIFKKNYYISNLTKVFAFTYLSLHHHLIITLFNIKNIMRKNK